MSQFAQTDSPAHPLSRPFDIGARMFSGVVDRLSDGLDSGQLALELPDGRQLHAQGTIPGPQANVRLNNYRVARHLALEGAVGLADSYVAGDWDSDDLTSVIALGATNLDSLATRFTPLGTMRLVARLHKSRRANTRRGSRRNIAAHYDLGNAFYAAWLDPSMTYSAACFENPGESLNAAQIRKFDRLAHLLELAPGDRLLEIGCGWGAFAIHAATNYGCRVTALTVSPAQAEWARRKIADAGLADSVEVRLQDYRDVTGTFDKIASIEMFEAVGERHWPVFFDALRSRLRPGGIAGLQIITIDEARFDEYRKNPDFIQLRIFPGGMLPSVAAFARGAEQAGLAVTDSLDFGRDYAETLRRWRAAFEDAWPKISSQGFDARFQRLWRYYLCYCEAGFDAGNISVGQYRIAHA